MAHLGTDENMGVKGRLHFQQLITLLAEREADSEKAILGDQSCRRKNQNHKLP